MIVKYDDCRHGALYNEKRGTSVMKFNCKTLPLQYITSFNFNINKFQLFGSINIKLWLCEN